jgi:hypothetical protein
MSWSLRRIRRIAELECQVARALDFLESVEDGDVGCDSEAGSFASRSKRASRPGPPEKAAGCAYTRSTSTAIPWPPETHSVAIP